ncbi:MAG: class I SAM-dependent RNA methyltransferase [Clostridia bacterium]|nr:class I SAM-dependent RNA methyltransferase [Clostridia bacterium]
MEQFVVPCLMGVEGLVADELRFGGFRDVSARNGGVLFSGGAEDCARANISLRCGERVLLRVAEFRAYSFEELFQHVRALPWEEYIGRKDAFPVKGHCIGSRLHSVPDCQRIIKKAAAERLKEVYGGEWLEESGSRRQIQFAILNDGAEIYLDTTGAPLYKRGYKQEQGEAGLRETLAASMVKLARYRGREAFFDPFCGSGTIAIEAALAALNLRPGAQRGFDAEQWSDEYRAAFCMARQEAEDAARHEKLPIYASDIDPEMVRIAEKNAEAAGVRDCIEISCRDALEIDYPAAGVVMSNPPYGVRLLDIEQARDIYRRLGERLLPQPELKAYVLTADTDFETAFGRAADKRRKLYNGMIRCDLHMYYRSRT